MAKTKTLQAAHPLGGVRGVDRKQLSCRNADEAVVDLRVVDFGKHSSSHQRHTTKTNDFQGDVDDSSAKTKTLQATHPRGGVQGVDRTQLNRRNADEAVVDLRAVDFAKHGGSQQRTLRGDVPQPACDRYAVADGVGKAP